MFDMLEYLGAATAIIGSLMITHKLPGYTYGFVFFLVASVSLAVYFLHNEQYGAFVMELIFIYSNVIGIRNWIFGEVKNGTTT